jgi:hypothetical protein
MIRDYDRILYHANNLVVALEHAKDRAGGMVEDEAWRTAGFAFDALVHAMTNPAFTPTRTEFNTMMGPIHACTHEIQPDGSVAPVVPTETPGALPARVPAAPALRHHSAGAAPLAQERTDA